MESSFILMAVAQTLVTIVSVAGLIIYFDRKQTQRMDRLESSVNRLRDDMLAGDTELRQEMRADKAELLEAMRQDKAELRADHSAMRQEMHSDKVELRADNSAMRQEMHSDKVELLKAMRADKVELRQEMRTDKAELRADNAELRQEMRDLQTGMRALNSKVDRMQGNLDIIVFGSQQVPPPITETRRETEREVEEALGD